MRGHNCAAHKHSQLVPLEAHHVWPKQYHGPDTPANKVTICANAHSDTHYLLEAMLRQHPYDAREYGPGVRILATRGYLQVMAYGKRLARQAQR